ncbi:type I methionyl aminopeptidase [Microbacter margulisiae]|uniref:Methionine aminopeptidase n=1 Tax=Microbacter margulisiae TaxID=1350067 RepID=A0A7W5DT13_9PORP|nr:type I methionyl aminopeptidase [Microbacter margulisiae]MBB3188064.1 methionyl aminopeptidase [Microbacter margulisiae]
MIYLKTEEQIELLRESNLIVSMALAEVAKAIKPGVTTLELDKIAEECIRDHGAMPAFLGYYGYPNTLCTSLNDQVVHGIPSNEVFLQEGDILSVDCGATKNGFVGDSAYTFAVGTIDASVLKLLKTTKEALYLGIAQAVDGNRLGDVGYAVQSHCENQGFGVVRDMVGHGVGKDMHEDPQVPNTGRRGNGVKLRSGMTIAIEPMITMGTYRLIYEKDGWTTRTADRKWAAHFEHSIAIRDGKADILSTFDFIEKVVGVL